MKTEPYEPIIKNTVIQASLNNVKKTISDLRAQVSLLEKEKSELETKVEFYQEQIESWRTVYIASKEKNK